MSTIEEAAKAYYERGWVPLAQIDRKPMVAGWNRLTLSDPRTRRQPWERATGVGLLTGRASMGLAALDIDDPDFARNLFDKLTVGGRPFRWHWSRSGAGHLLFTEVDPSFGGPRQVKWEGRDIHIDLKSNFHGAGDISVGASLTAPPTPGYQLSSETPPAPVETLQKALDAICMVMGAVPVAKPVHHDIWPEFVPDGERNSTLYSEARALAMARMPYERAVELLKANMALSYADKIDSKEFEDSVRSAYRRFWPKTSIANDPRYAR